MSAYIDFFRGLKRTPDGAPDPGRVIVAALAGSTHAVRQCLGGAGKPELFNVCSGSTGLAYPAFRLQAVVDAFAQEEPPPTLPGDARHSALGYSISRDFSDICQDNFSHTLGRLGERIVAGLGPACLGTPALTDQGELACAGGELIRTSPAGDHLFCGQGNLYDAQLYVTEATPSGPRAVPRCHRELFDPRKGPGHCSQLHPCPCWRLVPSRRCGATPGAAPHAVEVLRQSKVSADVTGASLCHGTAGHAWGSAEAAAMAPRVF